MQGISGIALAYSTLGIIKEVLEAFVYISIIVVSFKGLQALNLYISKNT